jgi:hypothetical protein
MQHGASGWVPGFSNLVLVVARVVLGLAAHCRAQPARSRVAAALLRVSSHQGSRRALTVHEAAVPGCVGSARGAPCVAQVRGTAPEGWFFSHGPQAQAEAQEERRRADGLADDREELVLQLQVTRGPLEGSRGGRAGTRVMRACSLTASRVVFVA